MSCALFGELLADAVDVGAVIAWDVEDVPGPDPFLGGVAHRTCTNRSEIARTDEDRRRLVG